MSYLQHARYNGKVCLYPQGIEQFTVNHEWLSSYGPTPSYWYDASTMNLTIDRVDIGANLADTSPSLYSHISERQNGLAVTEKINSNISTAYHGTSSVAATQFVVFRMLATPEYSYYSTVRTDLFGTFPFGSSGVFIGYPPIGLSASTSVVFQSRHKSNSGDNSTFIMQKIDIDVDDKDYKIAYMTSNRSSSPTVLGFINGVTASSYSPPSGAAIQDFAWGATWTYESHLYGKGMFAEILEYTYELSAAEITSVVNYLKNKWGLTY